MFNDKRLWTRIVLQVTPAIVLAGSALAQGVSEKDQKAADAIIEHEMGKLQQKEAATYPCSLFKTDEVAAIVGSAVDSGAYTFDHRTEDDRSFRSSTCSWSAKVEDGGSLDLWVSRKENFDSGKVECYTLSSTPAPGNLPGLGTGAWWDFEKYFGMGTLRVCSEKTLLEVKVFKKGADEGAVKGMARKVAEKVLSTP